MNPYERIFTPGVFLAALAAEKGIRALSLAGVVMLGHTILDHLLGLELMDGDTFTHTHLNLLASKARPA